ncbi:Formin-like protein 9 [Dissostichus eleginoides]|uniref:Formin-like protein 9 n=1 Tax=Dissostichus eleginoides TaxID=100907 RepID=A0AAD9CJ34_DISEL|nr:Formin-like protein 9 [Dissostichus eleginoides]
MCFLKGRRGGKSPSCPRSTAATPEPPPPAFLQRQQKFPERGVSANSNRASLSSLWAAGRPCGPTLLPEGSLQLEHFE